jgi:hypothetical protein
MVLSKPANHIKSNSEQAQPACGNNCLNLAVRQLDPDQVPFNTLTWFSLSHRVSFPSTPASSFGSFSPRSTSLPPRYLTLLTQYHTSHQVLHATLVFDFRSFVSCLVGLAFFIKVLRLDGRFIRQAFGFYSSTDPTQTLFICIHLRLSTGFVIAIVEV